MYAVYSGAKAYVELFSRSLYAELKPFGVTVQVRAWLLWRPFLHSP